MTEKQPVNVIDIRPLKTLAVEILPKNYVLRESLLREPDSLLAEEFVDRIPIWLGLLDLGSVSTKMLEKLIGELERLRSDFAVLKKDVQTLKKRARLKEAVLPYEHSQGS